MGAALLSTGLPEQAGFEAEFASAEQADRDCMEGRKQPMSLEKRSSVILCPESVEGPGKCTLMSRDEKPSTFKNAFKIPDCREKRALVCC